MDTDDRPDPLHPSTPEPPGGYDAEELADWPHDQLAGLSQTRLLSTSPVVLAGFLERLSVDDRRAVLRRLPAGFAPEVVAEMHREDAAEMVAEMREPRAVELLEELELDDAADVVAELPEDDRERLLGKLEPETAEAVKSLLSFDPETAGGLMNPIVATARPHLTVEQAIASVRATSEEREDIFFVYVQDADDRLVGVISIRRLILARPSQRLGDIMRTTFQALCHPSDDREAVAHRLAEFNLPEIAVVDDEGRLLGTITADDVIDVLREEATEDIQMLAGASGDERVHDSLLRSLARRHPWLQLNLLTAFLAAGVVYLFHRQIEQLSLLAVFMPVVAGLGGNTGNQALAVAIRGLALGELPEADHRAVLLREALKGLVNGLVIGLLAAGLAYLLLGLPAIAAVVLLAMVLNMALGGLAGAFIPLLLHRLGRDPAQSSTIILTALTDTGGFFIFLSLGTWLLL